MHHVDADGVVRVSITADRAKYVNVQRQPWAALHVTQPDFWAYAVLEGPAELAPVAAAPTTTPRSRSWSRCTATWPASIPDWDEYRRVMVDERRTVVRLHPDHAYGMLPA